MCCITSCLYVLKSKARQTAASWYGHHQTHAQNHLTRAMPGNHKQLLFVSNLSCTSKQPLSFLTLSFWFPITQIQKKKKTTKGTKNSVDCAKLQAISFFRKCPCICDQCATACTLWKTSIMATWPWGDRSVKSAYVILRGHTLLRHLNVPQRRNNWNTSISIYRI